MKKQGTTSKHLLILSFFNLLIFTSCEAFQSTQSSSGSTGNSTPPACTDGSSNYPWLKAGYELHYYYKGSVKSDSMIVKVISATSPGSYKAEIRYPAAGKTNTIFYHACGQDLYTSSTGNYYQYKYWWFSLTARVNELWSRETPGFLYTYQLMGKNVSVTTPTLKRTFTNCYKFTGHDPFNNLNDTIYFKPDIGVVYFSGTKERYELAGKNFGN